MPLAEPENGKPGSHQGQAPSRFASGAEMVAWPLRAGQVIVQMCGHPAPSCQFAAATALPTLPALRRPLPKCP